MALLLPPPPLRSPILENLPEIVPRPKVERKTRAMYQRITEDGYRSPGNAEEEGERAVGTEEKRTQDTGGLKSRCTEPVVRKVDGDRQ